MATELGLLSLTHLHKLVQSQDNQNQDQNLDQLNPNTINNTSTTTTSNITSTATVDTTSSTNIASWMWNPKAHQAEEDDSWEVRAFAEDTGNVMGTTWPPRSYTCAFCRREFRSAQALGGHMNVHRRDRARLHQVMPPNSIINHPSATAVAAAAAAVSASSSNTASSSFLIPTGEFVAGRGGLCLLYQLPNPNNTAYGCSRSPPPSPSTLLSVSPYPPRNLARSSFSPSANFSGGDNNAYRVRHDQYLPNRAEEASEFAENDGNEELDLELRLGQGPTPSWLTKEKSFG